MGQIIRIGGTPLPDSIRQRPATDNKRALVLGGGGISGAAFHIGCLLALDDAFEGYDVCDFDLFVGTSAGAFVAACLANGISPEELARSQMGRRTTGLPPIRRREVLRRVKGRLPHGVAASAGVVRSTLRQMGRTGVRTSLLDTLFSLTEGVAAWRLYTTAGIEEYLRKIFAMAGRTDDFEELQRQLFVVATDLDTAERIVFGEPQMPGATVSGAVSASAAIPIIYEPVVLGGREYLDGGLQSTTNLDIALSHGASFVVLINPLVPYLHDARYLLRTFDSTIRHVSDGGLARLVAQVFRIMAHAHLEKELELTKVKYPDADILVVEPHRNNEHLFVFNLMDYSARIQMAREAYGQVAIDLVTHFPDIEKLFASAGLRLSRAKLVEQLKMVVGGGTADALLAQAEQETA